MNAEDPIKENDKFGFKENLSSTERRRLNESVEKGVQYLIDYNNALQSIIAKAKEEQEKRERK